MDYNKFNIEEKYDSYRNITPEEAEKIISKLEKALKTEESYDLSILTGKMLLKLSRYKEAISEIHNALSFRKSDEAFDLISYAYYKVGELDKALYYINKSFDLFIDEFVYNHKAKILEELGDYEEAFNIYYEGLKFLIDNNKSYGDLEIFGENVARIAIILKEKYRKDISIYIAQKDCKKLYETYMKLLDIIIKEEENDQYHNLNNKINFNYLEIVESGKEIFINEEQYLELLSVYIKLYYIEEHSEIEELEYINKDYIDNKIRALVETVINNTSLETQYETIVDFLNSVIEIRNRDYYNYLYHKGYIQLRKGTKEEALETLNKIIKDSKADVQIIIEAYECILQSFNTLSSFEGEVFTEYKMGLSNFLKQQLHDIFQRKDISLDIRCSVSLEYCYRGINLNLEKEYWDSKTEEISLYFGEEYEVISGSQTIFNVIENYNKAIKIYDKLLEFNPNCGHGYYRKGRAIVLVLRILNSSMATTKDAKAVHELECYTYSEVVFNLNKAISLNRHNPKYFNLLSRTHFEIEEFEKSLQYIDKALELDDKDLYINLNKTCVLIRSNKFIEAIDLLFKVSLKETYVSKVTKTFLPKRDILNFLMGIFNIYPRQDKIYYLISYYFYKIIDFEFVKALTFVNNAIEICDDERYFLLKAKIYYKNKEFSQAVSCCDEALMINEYYDEAHELKDKCNGHLTK